MLNNLKIAKNMLSKLTTLIVFYIKHSCYWTELSTSFKIFNFLDTETLILSSLLKNRKINLLSWQFLKNSWIFLISWAFSENTTNQWFPSTAFSFLTARRESCTLKCLDGLRRMLRANCRVRDLWKKPPLFCFLPAARRAVNFFREIFLRRRRGKGALCVFMGRILIYTRALSLHYHFRPFFLHVWRGNPLKRAPGGAHAGGRQKKGNVRWLTTITTLFLSAPIPSPVQTEIILPAKRGT